MMLYRRRTAGSAMTRSRPADRDGQHDPRHGEQDSQAVARRQRHDQP